MQGKEKIKRDVLWTVSIPFRMNNTKELDLNNLIFTLSFDAGLPNCNVSTARKLVNFAIESKFIAKRADNKNIIEAKFELWEPKYFPLDWHPDLSKLEETKMVELIPLDSTIEYKPEVQNYVRTPEHAETMISLMLGPIIDIEKKKRKSPLISAIQEDGPKKKQVIEEEENEKEPLLKEKPIKSKDIKKEKQETPKKEKKSPENEKKKGQKSLQDFFR
ncbi:MAG TPA: DUF2240 family protein [Candidatus Deferrimicrobium sp.]|nr:DUF2240 family protein [Candidatus Deferrimicrobium sp.]